MISSQPSTGFVALGFLALGFVALGMVALGIRALFVILVADLPRSSVARRSPERLTKNLLASSRRHCPPSVACLSRDCGLRPLAWQAAYGLVSCIGLGPIGLGPIRFLEI